MISEIYCKDKHLRMQLIPIAYFKTFLPSMCELWPIVSLCKNACH